MRNSRNSVSSNASRSDDLGGRLDALTKRVVLLERRLQEIEEELNPGDNK